MRIETKHQRIVALLEVRTAVSCFGCVGNAVNSVRYRRGGVPERLRMNHMERLTKTNLLPLNACSPLGQPYCA